MHTSVVLQSFCNKYLILLLDKSQRLNKALSNGVYKSHVEITRKYVFDWKYI